MLFAYIKVLGVKTEDHPIMKELARIQQSMKDFKALEQRLKNKENATEKSKDDAKQFLQNTLGTTGGEAAPDKLKQPAISASNFKGTHIKFDDADSSKKKRDSKPANKKTAPAGKVTKKRR